LEAARNHAPCYGRMVYEDISFPWDEQA
jgi:hypothetical protein